MNIGFLGNLLKCDPTFQLLRDTLNKEESSSNVQMISEATPFTLSTLWMEIRRPVLVVTADSRSARRLYERLLIYGGTDVSILHFPESDTLPFERITTDTATTQQRIRTLAALANSEIAPPLLVASAPALAQKTIDRYTFESATHTLRSGDTTSMKELLELWEHTGYKFQHNVNSPGEYSRRGGILDIFPVGSESPVRFELWGDEIDSVRAFNPETQISIRSMSSVTIHPAEESLPGILDPKMLDLIISRIDFSNCTADAKRRLSQELNLLMNGNKLEDLNFYSSLFSSGSLLDFFPADGVLVMDTPTEILEATHNFDERMQGLRKIKEQRGELPESFPAPYFIFSEIQNFISQFRHRLDLTQWGTKDFGHHEAFVLPFDTAGSYSGNIDRFTKETVAMLGKGHLVVTITSAPIRLREILEESGIDTVMPKSMDVVPSKGAVTILGPLGSGLSEGLTLSTNDQKLVVLGDEDIFGTVKRRRSTRQKPIRQHSFLSDLSSGDFVVHVQHGVGRFVGIDQVPKDKNDREYLVIEYASKDKLFVPMEHLDRVSPYVAPLDRPPKLNRLGTQEWANTKKRVARSAMEMANELLSLYAAREMVNGHKCSPDTPWQAEIENAFPYEETLDQLEAIKEVKTDMERDIPMDRLICGDVGYGKTEVALRSAFKCVMGGMQVAILVPTTVLAQQHYETFAERLRAYPVNIEVLSRFRSIQKQREIVEKLKGGSIDICIGTHRLVQKDVIFKKLGLVIIDEEQRFGVTHKEQLKQMRHEVDVLTMTATPIPRTLHLSLAGIRDMSMIETPPEERLPIKTSLSEFSDELILEAIRLEMDRQGQVFFLHNRVRDIDYIANHIRKIVPESTVGVAHGQMAEDRLEQTMVDFAGGKMDVLVCTTIIESGLDIPNVNTLIVDRADQFGLSQLYQLRGRIGRGSRRAYSYMLIPPSKSLTESAEKRLKTILAATELGAGFQIAIKDLEIRGAGNVLGADQSGHIHSVGFDLYTRLLEEAVKDIRAQDETASVSDAAPVDSNQKPVDRTSIDLKIPANIPDDYVSDIPTRLSMYRKMVTISTLEEVAALEGELLDRFGPFPVQTSNLLYMARLRVKAENAGILSISRTNTQILLKLREEVGGANRPLQKALGNTVDVGQMQIRLNLHKLSASWEEHLVTTVDKLAIFRSQLSSHLV